MKVMKAIGTTELPLPLVRRGKVRDVYDAGDDRLLIVATDRISAFDVVLPQPIPFKGAVLTQVTAWWLEQLGDIVSNHLLSARPEVIEAAVPALADSRDEWIGRAMLVRRTDVVPIECVVRGYLSGSAWSEYRKSGTLAGEPLPEGLVESARLDPPIFSPATKAEEGHDENITFARMSELVGAELAERLRSVSLAVYERGRAVAEQAGMIVADTKFEFGHDASGELLLIDEVLTPDSSRFWPAETYATGRGQPSLDKQPVRDYLDALTTSGAWNKAPPAPDLPESVVRETSERYQALFRRLTGRTLEDVLESGTGAATGAGD